ncbi:Alpha/Beta hydrolase protein [Ochromonadaceae sp. CCMP2298]|nr:Alpha/Beta hydrolase protein [Ochromonadaceae sp. CCMP2298]
MIGILSRRSRVVGLSLLGSTAGFTDGRWSNFTYAEGKKEVKKEAGLFDPFSLIKPAGKVKEEFDPLSLVPDALIDPQMKASLRELARFAETVMARVDVQPEHPLVTNIGLLRLYVNSKEKGADKDPNTWNSHTERAESGLAVTAVTDEFLALATHYFNFADQAYSSPIVNQSDILLNQLAPTTARVPGHVVFLDHLTSTVVVAIRGTASASDVLTDLYMDTIPFLEPKKGIFAHQGMGESAALLLEPVTAAIHQAHTMKKGRYATYSVVVTGHSLGAGTACLLSALLQQDMDSQLSKLSSSKIPGIGIGPVSVTTYAFAPPPVISQAYIKYFKQHKNPTSSDAINPPTAPPAPTIHCFVHDRNIIPRASHMQFLSLVSALATLDSLPFTALERSGILLRGSLKASEWQQIHTALTTRKQLHDGGEVLKVEEPGLLFNGLMYYGDSMVTDHLCDSYRKALLRIVK